MVAGLMLKIWRVNPLSGGWLRLPRAQKWANGGLLGVEMGSTTTAGPVQLRHLQCQVIQEGAVNSPGLLLPRGHQL